VARSRRKAREAALQALYEIEIGKAKIDEALSLFLDPAEFAPENAAYAEKLVRGIRSDVRALDAQIAPLVRDYEYSRLAAVDRNVLRLAAFELLSEPAIPPAVTINEAVEIAKRFSTAESGKFVNGVLGRFLQDTPKTHWDPDKAPPEEWEELVYEPAPAIEEEVVEAESDEGKTARRYGVWKVRSDESAVE